MSSTSSRGKSFRGKRGGYRGRGKGGSRNKSPSSPGYCIQIDKQSCNLQESNFTPFIEGLVDTVIKEVKLVRDTSPNRKLKINLSLERNKINDVCIGMLVECLCQLVEFIEVDIIRLHMNSIHDDGMKKLSELIGVFPVSEVHLSHNYITWEGFQHFCHAALKSTQYPLNTQSPLWLRLEYNQIDINKIETLLAHKKFGALMCSVKRRGNRKGECNIHYCGKPVKFTIPAPESSVTSLPKALVTKLHVPYILFQKQSLKSLCNLSGLTAKKTNLKPLNKESRSIESIAKSEEPLLLVLDTCTIISMCENKNFFSFDCLLEMKQKKLFADNIRFILVDTVFQQLDARKKETKKNKERIAIRHFVDDIMSEATKCNLLHYIHPMELEDEVRARGGHIGNQNFRKENGKFDSDGLILDCAFYLMEQSPDNVIVLTDDIPCKARALMNHLPAETLREMMKKMGQDPTECISRASIITSCTTETLRIFGVNQKNIGSPKPRGGLITELNSATELVQKLSILLKESMKHHPNDDFQVIAESCFKSAQSSIDNWTTLIDSHQQLRKLTRDQPSSTTSSPSLFDSPDISFRSLVSTFTSQPIPMNIYVEEEEEEEEEDFDIDENEEIPLDIVNLIPEYKDEELFNLSTHNLEIDEDELLIKLESLEIIPHQSPSTSSLDPENILHNYPLYYLTLHSQSQPNKKK